MRLRWVQPHNKLGTRESETSTAGDRDLGMLTQRPWKPCPSGVLLGLVGDEFASMDR